MATDNPPLSNTLNTDHTQAGTSPEQNPQLAVCNVPTILNPNASPFESQVNSSNIDNQVPGPSQQRGRGKGKKSVTATDMERTELDFVKLEVSTLKARLQKQESELKDLKFKNSILVARNKSLEEIKKQDIYEKYFPSRPPHSQASNSSCNGQTYEQHSTHHCCIQPAFHCRPSGCPHQSLCPGNNTGHDSNNSIEMINKKLEDLSTALQKHQQSLDTLLQTSVSSVTTSLSPSPPTQAPTSNPTAQPTPTASTDHADNSIISLDGFMVGEDDKEMDLN